MATLGPHTPKKGWALRWSRQALALTVAAPNAFVILAGSVLALGTLGLAAHQVLGGLGGVAASAGLAALALLPAALVSNQLLAADGRGSRTMSELWSVMRPILAPVFAVALAQGLLASLAGASGFGSGLASLTELEAVMSLGLGAYLGAATILTVLNVFWLGASAALGLDAAEAWNLQELISKREGKVFLAVLLVTLVLSQALLALHPVLGLAMLLVYQAWNYVAGREVLGGIDENGSPQGARSLGLMGA